MSQLQLLEQQSRTTTHASAQRVPTNDYKLREPVYYVYMSSGELPFHMRGQTFEQNFKHATSKDNSLVVHNTVHFLSSYPVSVPCCQRLHTARMVAAP